MYLLHCIIILPKQGAYAVKYVLICMCVCVCVCVTFQNLKLSLSGTDVGDSRAANNGREVSSMGDNAMPSPLTPLHARLRAAVQKPVQVGYHVAVQ
jgi:hypothetical protein